MTEPNIRYVGRATFSKADYPSRPVLGIAEAYAMLDRADAELARTGARQVKLYESENMTLWYGFEYEPPSLWERLCRSVLRKVEEPK